MSSKRREPYPGKSAARALFPRRRRACPGGHRDRRGGMGARDRRHASPRSLRAPHRRSQDTTHLPTRAWTKTSKSRCCIESRRRLSTRRQRAFGCSTPTGAFASTARPRSSILKARSFPASMRAAKQAAAARSTASAELRSTATSPGRTQPRSDRRELSGLQGATRVAALLLPDAMPAVPPTRGAPPAR